MESSVTAESSKLPSLLRLTLDEYHHGLDTGAFSTSDLVKAYLARIKEVDGEFRSILEINPNVLQLASELDQERSTSGRRGPLHGVPMVLKDNIVTTDNLEATAGSSVLLGAKPSTEGTVAHRLRNAGAIILGKSNLSEWSNLRSLNYSSPGWSARGGQCTGAYYPGMDAGGSSTGSAVSTALGLTFAALGTETDGSLVGPADRSNVVTIRPTTGLTPRDLVIPFSKRQDTVGPIARCVKDAATVLSIIAGRSENDEPACESINMIGIRLGIPRNAISNIDETQQRLFKHALEVLKAAGAEIIDHADLLGLEEFENQSGATKKMASEADFRVGMAEYLSTLSTNPRNLESLDDIIEWTKKDTAEEYPKRDVARMERAAAIDIESEEYKQVMARDEYFAGEGGIIGALDRHSLDALVTISPVDTAITFAVKAGSPVITVPVGVYPPDTKVKIDEDTGLVEIAPNVPLSTCFYGRRYSDELLIRLAHAFEQRTLAQTKAQPFKLPKTELRDVIGKRPHELKV